MTPVPAPVQEILALFGNDLGEVRFPELDARVLDVAAEEVASAAEVVAAAEAELRRARGQLAERQEALLARAQRALAYLRIYAEDHPDLAARIEAISLPRGGRRTGRAEGGEAAAIPAGAATPRRRGRPPRAATDGPLLAFEEKSDAGSAVAPVTPVDARGADLGFSNGRPL